MSPARDLGDWEGYLSRYHREHPAITERVLAGAGSRGETPYGWMVEPIRQLHGPVLDLACGSAPTRDLLSEKRWVGLDSSVRELAAAAAAGRGPLVRGRADRLPLRDNAIGVVCAAMCLQVLTPLDLVLAELKRVLRPGGVLVALVPSSRPGPDPRGWLDWWRTLRALGISSLPWPNPRALDGLAAIVDAYGFVVDSDERRVFRRDLTGPADAALLVDGLYLPGVDRERRSAATRVLAARARPGRWLPMPLRRVVAHLDSSHVRMVSRRTDRLRHCWHAPSQTPG